MKKRYTEEQIVRILREAERADKSISQVCREFGVTETTFYRWRKMYGNMDVDNVKRLRVLESENSRLKRLLAERMIEIDAMKGVLSKKW